MMIIIVKSRKGHYYAPVRERDNINTKSILDGKTIFTTPYSRIFKKSPVIMCRILEHIKRRAELHGIDWRKINNLEVFNLPAEDRIGFS